MPPLPPDPYKTLGVSNTAPLADIRTAYRKLVLTCHPDKVHDPAQKGQKLEEFQKLQHAYELLTDDKERSRYDEQVLLMELRKEVAKNMPNTSAPRTPRTTQTYNVSIRTAEPRPSTYAQSPPQAGSRLYAQYSGASKDYTFAEEKARTTKRSPSYEKPSSSRKEKEYDEDKERKERERTRRRREREEEREEREKERDAEREREREREHVRERERRLADKDSRKAEKKRQDKERKSTVDDKRQHRSGMYVEEYDEVDMARPEKKKSSSRKHREREREHQPTPVVDIGLDTHAKVMHAEHYIQARSYPGLDRAATFDASAFRNSPPSVPTPPPPRDSPYPPPPSAPHVMDDSDDSDEDDEVIHRSRAASRRGSYDPSRSSERVFTKKSYSSIKDDPIMSTSPGRLSMMSESPPRGSLPKASTFHEGSHRSSPKSTIPPSPVRTYTYPGDSTDPRDPRGRSRSRFHPQRVEEEEEDEEEERLQHLRKHRSRREPSTDPISIPYGKKYSYGGEGRSAPREPSYRNSPDSRNSKSYFPSSGSSGHRVIDMAYSPESRAHYTKARTTKRFESDDVAYAQYSRAHREVDAHY